MEMNSGSEEEQGQAGERWALRLNALFKHTQVL